MGKYDKPFKLNSDYVYTSNYSLANKVLPNSSMVSISLTYPDWFKGEKIRELNPTSDIFWQYKYGEMTVDAYTRRYYDEVLSKLDPQKVYEKVRGKVMLCWCKDGEFCHRYLVSEWLTDNIKGIEGIELKRLFD